MERTIRLSGAQDQATDADEQLVRAVARGESDALDELMRRNGPWVRGVIFAVCRRADMVDDVQQKVWLSVWRRAATLEDPSRWRGWLYTLAQRAAIDAGRAQGRRQRLVGRLKDMLGAGRHKPAAGLRNVELAEEHQRALRAVKNLPETYRTAFVLRHLSGFSYREIAETMGVPTNSVGSLLMRARHLLQDALGEDDES